MAIRKPTYMGGAEALPQEVQPTGDEVLVGKLTASGVGGIAVDAGGARVANVATPTTGTDAANKSYVDSNGGAQIKVVEVDVGPVAVEQATVVVTDASLTANSKVIVLQRGGATSTKDADESEMDHLHLIGTPAAGSLSVFIRGLEGQIHGSFNLAYMSSP